LPSLAIVGPTASGKSTLALAYARAVTGVELVAVDSMQVYRGMDIGTAKPTPADRAEVVHHGLDLAEPTEEVTVVRFQAAAAAATAITARKHRRRFVGGTGVPRGHRPPTHSGQWPEVQADIDEPGHDQPARAGRVVRLRPTLAPRIPACLPSGLYRQRPSVLVVRSGPRPLRP
jgi:tRNA dimethylallyltransferase